MEDDHLEFYCYYESDPFAPKINPPNISDNLSLIDRSIDNVCLFLKRQGLYAKLNLYSGSIDTPNFPSSDTEEKIEWLNWITNILYRNDLIYIRKDLKTISGKSIKTSGNSITT